MADSGYPIGIISIHALREESDVKRQIHWHSIQHFNPRSP